MYDVEIIRGTTNNFTVQIQDDEGVKYKPTPGDLLVMGVKKNKNDKDFVFVKSAPVGSDGSAQIKIRPEDTCDLCCDKYYFDIGMESGSDFYTIIPMSEFRILSNITRRGCANG